MFRGTSSPLRNCKTGDLDWVIIRENSEGEYAGQGGRSHRGQPWETATEVAMFTRHGVERIMRFAFETARSRPRKLLTIVTKSNAQRNGMVLWDEVAADVAKDFPDVTTDKMLVDAMTCRMVLKPESIDTIVATNLVSVLTQHYQQMMQAAVVADKRADSFLARRHSLRSGSRISRFHRYSTNIESRPYKEKSLYV